MIWLLLTVICLSGSTIGNAESMELWQLFSEDGKHISDICYEPVEGDQYIDADNMVYEVVRVEGAHAVVALCGSVLLPDVKWLNVNDAVTVAALSRRIGLYCTHSDESYEPSDGVYSTTERGSIYQVAEALAAALEEERVHAIVADTLHHPHDAGAYRRSRQTAINLLKRDTPDCLIDIHRDGIPDPASYAVEIGGQEASKIRLLVGRGNQNAALNKEFALLIKAVADNVYPGLIKDIYLGKGAFNQDLLPRSILFECGTYTLPKERVLASMPLLADVLSRALYGGITGSARRIVVDSTKPRDTDADIVQGAPDVIVDEEKGIRSGSSFLGILLFAAIVGMAMLSAGSFGRGGRKAARNLNEMTGGLLGKKPSDGEEHEHS